MKKKLFIISAVVVVSIVIIVFAVGRNNGSTPEFSSTMVEKTDLVQSVEETGAIAAGTDITYGFEISGKVAAVDKQVGDTVSSTDVIATLNDTVQQSALSQANAALQKAQALLNLELAGPSSETIAESQAKVDKAQASLDQATIQLKQVQTQNTTKLQNAERDVQTAESDLRLAQNTDSSLLVADAVQDLFNALQASIPTISDGLREADAILGIDNSTSNDDFENQLGVLNSSIKLTAETNYTITKARFANAQNSLNTVTDETSESQVVGAYAPVLDALTKNRTMLLSVKSLLDASISGGSLTEAGLDTMKADVLTELGSTNTDITNATNKRQGVDEAKTSLQKKQIAYDRALDARNQTRDQAKVDEAVAKAKVSIERSALAQAKAAHQALIAPPRSVDVASLRADVAKQQAAVLSAAQDVEKTKLRAITDGVIATLDVDPGDTITANTDLVTIISSQKTIEVDVSETDIAKVSIGDEVEITLDAFGDDEIFKGVVRSIEPAETEISGVIYYNTDITLLLEDDDRIRPGMTANVQIVTDTKPQVLVAPQRALIRTDSGQVIRVLTDKRTGSYEERAVTTGIRGDNGVIEITSGLTEGEEIITFLRES